MIKVNQKPVEFFNYTSKLLFIILVLTLYSCQDSVNQSSDYVTAADTTAATATEPVQSIDVRHKYSYVKLNEDGSKVVGLLELYGTNDYTQAVSINGFTQSGRGTFYVNGDKVTLSRTSGIAIDGVLDIKKGNDNTIWLILSNGVTYVEDDNSAYLKSLKVTPNQSSSLTTNEQSNSSSETNADITYEGTVTDEQSGVSQFYSLYIKPDFSAASIGGGPFTRIEDQGDGSYMWIDGTIMGMSFRPMQNRCVMYGSDGNYFCTLYRKN